MADNIKDAALVAPSETEKNLQEANELQAREIQNLRAKVGSDTLGKPIAGELNLTLTDKNGAKKTGIARFADGHVRVKVMIADADVNGECDSEALMAHANGKAMPQHFAANPVLSQLTSDEAKDYITDLVKRGYSYISISS